MSAAGYLFDGETVALQTRHHLVVLVKPSLVPLGALVLVSAVPSTFTFLLLLAGVLRFGWAYLLWYKDLFVLTDNRIIATSGIITTSVVSMPLSKITDLTYTRSVAGRLLGYGKLHLESAGQMQLESIDHLPDPDHFYRCVMAFALGPAPEDVAEEVELNRIPQSSSINADGLVDQRVGRPLRKDDVPVVDSKPSKASSDTNPKVLKSRFVEEKVRNLAEGVPRADSKVKQRETFEERRARILASRDSD